MRAFTSEQVAQMVRDARDDEARRLPLELMRLYAVEDARASTDGALQSLLMSTHQQLHAAARTLESAIRINQPKQQAPQQPDEPTRRRPRMLGEDDPAE